MPDQPAGIQQRIAEILETHMIRTDPNHPAYRRCRCGNQARDDELGDYELEDWRHHVAEVLTSELGLIEERQHKHPFGYGEQQQIRYVTEWSDE